MAEHRFNEGECDICGYIAEASHLDFELSEDGSYYIVVGEGNYTVKNLHIPSIHNDKAVKKIGASAFERNKIVRNIVLPDSIVEIGQNAFQFNEVLKSIAIPQSVQKIGAGAFSGCLNMNKVNITNVAAWCKINFADFYANPLYFAKNLYLNGVLLTDLSIPQGVESIGNNAFANCQNITNLSIANSVKKIGTKAFYACKNLANVCFS